MAVPPQGARGEGVGVQVFRIAHQGQIVVERGAGRAAAEAGVVQPEGEYPGIRVIGGGEAGDGGNRREEGSKFLFAVPVGDEGEGQAVGVHAGVVHLLVPAGKGGNPILRGPDIEGLGRIQPDGFPLLLDLCPAGRQHAVPISQHPHRHFLRHTLPGGAGIHAVGGVADLSVVQDLIAGELAHGGELHPPAGAAEHPLQQGEVGVAAVADLRQKVGTPGGELLYLVAVRLIQGADIRLGERGGLGAALRRRRGRGGRGRPLSAAARQKQQGQSKGKHTFHNQNLLCRPYRTMDFGTKGDKGGFNQATRSYETDSGPKISRQVSAASSSRSTKAWSAPVGSTEASVRVKTRSVPSRRTISMGA